MNKLTILNCKVLNDFFMWANSLKIRIFHVENILLLYTFKYF